MHPTSYTLVLLVWQAANLVASRAMVWKDIVLETDLVVGVSIKVLYLMVEDKFRFSL